MFGRNKQRVEQQPAQDARRYEPAASQPGDPTLPGVAGYIHQGKLPGRGKNVMPPNRFVYKRPDGRPD
jgi:hypothetical protein